MSERIAGRVCGVAAAEFAALYRDPTRTVAEIADTLGVPVGKVYPAVQAAGGGEGGCGGCGGETAARPIEDRRHQILDGARSGGAAARGGGASRGARRRARRCRRAVRPLPMDRRAGPRPGVLRRPDRRPFVVVPRARGPGVPAAAVGDRVSATVWCDYCRSRQVAVGSAGFEAFDDEAAARRGLARLLRDWADRVEAAAQP